MLRMPTTALPSFAAALAALVVLITGCAPGPAQAETRSYDSLYDKRGFVVPVVNPERGRALFVGKGCVVCHQINGVGGMAAPALDVDTEEPYADMFDFMARMWRGAYAMIDLQSMELGYQIDLTGEELADIFGFVHDRQEQLRFSIDDVPDLIRDWMVDERYDLLQDQEEQE